MMVIMNVFLNMSMTECPDFVQCLTNIVNMCFPDTVRGMFEDHEARCAVSPLVLINLFQRLQHFVTGGCTSDHCRHYFHVDHVICMSIAA